MPRMLECESYWAYRAPPTPAEGPPGFAGNWFALSPGMRREIWRDYERRRAAAKPDSGYAALVMEKFDEAERADRRALMDRKSAVQIAARERL